MTTTEEPAVLTVEFIDPRELVPHPRNVRTELGDLDGLTASIREQGVLEPLTVIPVDVERMILAGHRRAAAAIAAGLERVPCIVRADLSIDDVAMDQVDAAAKRTAADAIAAMLAENIHRANLTAVEEARGVQAMLDLGVPISKVAKATGLNQKRVKKAIGVARLDDDTAAAVTKHQLDLDAAAAVALFADDPQVTGRLVAAAERGPGQLAHELERAKQDRDRARRYEQKVGQLRAAGRTVVDDANWQGKKNRVLESLSGSQPRTEMTPEEHVDCPGSAVAVRATWGTEIRVDEVCTDPGKYGHKERYGGGATVKAKPETDEEKEAARAERRLVIENNKAMAAANATRRVWLKEFLARRTAPPEVLRFAVEFVAAQPRTLEHWLSGSIYGGEGDNSAKVMGLARPSQWRQTDVTLTSGEHVSDARLPLQLFAHVAAAVEASIAKDSWKTTDERNGQVASWLRFLAGQGYTLSDVEQQIVDGAAAGGAS